MFYNHLMDKRKYSNVIYILASLILLVALIVWKAAPPVGHFFEVVAVDNGEIIFRARVKPGYEFSTTFRHSVQLSDWTDFFRITDDWRIKLYETHFADMGWGFPSEPDPGAKMEMTRDYIRYYDMNRVFDSFQVSVTTANDRHFLIAGSNRVDFVKEAGPGRLLDFRVVAGRSKI